MRRRVSGLVATAIATVGLVVGTAAQQSGTKSETKTFTVIAVDGNQLVVKMPEGTREITVPEGFQFKVNGQPMSVHELKPGMSGTATITTTTTVTPVTVTEVRNATVEQVSGSAVIVRGKDGYRSFTQGEVDKRNFKIMKDGKPVTLSELHKGDQLTATIVTEKPPKVLTDRQVHATLDAKAPETAAPPTPAHPAPPAHAAPPVASTPTSTTGSSTPAAGASTLPKTASPRPLLALMGVAALLASAGLRFVRRRWIIE